MSGPFAVVGCTHCNALWVADKGADAKTSQCPRCGHDHDRDRLRAFNRFENHAEAAEYRTQMLAERADNPYPARNWDHISRWDDYGSLEQEVEQRDDPDQEKFADLVKAKMADWQNRSESPNCLGTVGMADQGVDPNYAAAEADRVLGGDDSRYEDLVEETRGDTADFELPPQQDGAGLSYTNQTPLEVDARVSASAITAPTTLWQAVFDGDQNLLGGLDRTAEAFADGRAQSEFLLTLAETLGCDTADSCGAVGSILLSVAGYRSIEQRVRTTDLVPRIGAGTIYNTPSTVNDMFAVLGLYTVIESPPTVAIELDEQFQDVDRGQRVQACELIAAMARVWDVRLVSTNLQREWLAEYHRTDLPGVSDRRKTRQPETNQAARVEQAKDELNHDDREVALLQALADASGESLAYSELVSQFTVSRSRIRQCLSRLSPDDEDSSVNGLGLVEVFETGAGKHASLLEAGRAYLSWYREQYGVQQSVSTFVNETSTSSDNSRVNTRAHGDGSEAPSAAAAEDAAGTPDRNRLPNHHEVRYLNAVEMSRMGAAPPEGGISVTNYPIGKQEDRGEAGWGYDDSSDRLYIATEGTGVLQQWVCHARALANWRTWEHILTDERLARSDLDGLVSSYKELLRGSRCLGYLPDGDVESASDYAEQLQDARDALLEMTRDLHHGNFADEDAFRGEIVRTAIGFVGTMEHVLDLVGVDVVREVRLPDFSRDFGPDRQKQLLKTFSTAVSICSKYNQSTAYRQLFEQDEERREWAIKPTVDAADPYGEVLGSWSIVGDFGTKADSFAAALESELSEPRQIHEDAPEFAVEVPIRTGAVREQFTKVLTEYRRHKGLIPTPKAVSLLHGLTRTVYDAGDVIAQLSAEEDSRHIRASEVRYGLAQLDSQRLLRGYSGQTTTPRKLLSTLLATEQPLSKTELDELAGVSADARASHLPDLVTTGLVLETDGGYRVDIAANTDEERHSERVPSYVRAVDDHPVVHKAAQTIDCARRFYIEGEAVEWRRCRALMRLRHHQNWVTDLLPALWGLSETRYAERAEAVSGEVELSLTFGQTPDQQPLSDAGAKTNVAAD